MMRVGLILGVSASLAGCATTTVTTFDAAATQTNMVRDGVPALLSKQKSSIVLVQPAPAGAVDSPLYRDAYVVAIFNPTNKPLNFSFGDLSVAHAVGDQWEGMRTYSYDDLVKEAKQQQAAVAVVTILAAGLNSAAAANTGYYNNSATVTGPGGVSTIHVSGYSPAAAAIASTNASIQNQQMINNAIDTGRQNLSALSRTIIKDDTILPGEWYGGVVQFDRARSGDAQTYAIRLDLPNGETHTVDVTETTKKG